jgi:hypothetical protein
MRGLAALAPVLALAACWQPAEDTAPLPEAEAEQRPAYSYDGWIGRWDGVEGMFVDIQPDGEGGWVLAMQSDLDTTATYAGTSTAEGIAFERGGQTLVLRESDGAATGLKWLDGKQDCLMVAEGEGYCRD